VSREHRLTDFDPITFSVILNRFDSIAKEMTLTLEYTAWTSILALARDFSCAIYDRDARQITMSEALPMHTSSLSIALVEIARTFAGDISEGDVIACNDPYRGNTHIGDLVTACPVFWEGEFLFWAVTKGHQLDCGAFIPSSVTPSSKNVWQEGITIPPIKLYEAGRERSDVIDLYLSNIRYRDLLLGDLLAQLGSIGKGKARLQELCAEYGGDVVRGYVDELIDYADRLTADSIRAMPDGTYKAEGWIDSDGFDQTDLPIKVQVTIEGEEIRIDYSGSASQAAGGVNGSLATMKAAGAVPVLMCLDPDIPHNEGCLKHIDVTAEEGSICWAKFPASTSCATIVPSDMMQDVVNKALAYAVPDLVAAGTPRCANIPVFSGVDERSGQPWGAMIFNNNGGGAAARNTDGWPLIGTPSASGGLKSLSIEQMELLYPMLIEQWEVDTNSSGLGASIGGAGTRFAVRPTHGPLIAVEFGDGRANPCHGVLGGTAGSGGGAYIESRATGKRRFVSATGEIEVGRDDLWVGVSSGGGGYGDPLERAPAAVAVDVRDGIIDRSVAEHVFGVVLDEGLVPLVREADTTALRQRLREQRGQLPIIVPTQARASRWLEEHMTEGDEYLLNPSIG
jgi:N-methylhydantoinase B